MSNARHNNKVRLHTILSPRIKYSNFLEVHDMTKSIHRLEARTEFCPVC